MPKGFLFWAIWILCLLSVLGFIGAGWNLIYMTSGVVLVLTGLLGWAVFGKPIQ